MVVIVVTEAAEERAENAPAAVLLQAAVGLRDWKRRQTKGQRERQRLGFFTQIKKNNNFTLKLDQFLIK